MAADDIVQQVLADDLLDEAIEKYGEVVGLARQLEPLWTSDLCLCKCRGSAMPPGTAAESRDVARKGPRPGGRGHRQARSGRVPVAGDVRSRSGAQHGVQLVEVLLADWNLRAHPGTLTDGLAVAREGIRRASHLDDAVRSGALTDEERPERPGGERSSRWPGYWQPDLRIRRKRTRPRPPPRPSVPHANALSDSS